MHGLPRPVVRRDQHRRCPTRRRQECLGGRDAIKGEKKQEKEHKDEQFYRIERSHGVFVRTIRLPGTVDGGKVTASFKNGLLTVTLPKAPGTKGAVIPVKSE